MAERKGVMFYFEVCKSIERLRDEQAGRLFKAALQYASTGVLPDFNDDVALDVAWGFMQGKIDRDGERYDEMCRKNRENQRLRWEREREKVTTGVFERIPTATASTTSTATAAAAATVTAAQSHLNRFPAAEAAGGTGGENFASLSSGEQLKILKREAGL